MVSKLPTVNGPPPDHASKSAGASKYKRGGMGIIADDVWEFADDPLDDVVDGTPAPPPVPTPASTPVEDDSDDDANATRSLKIRPIAGRAVIFWQDTLDGEDALDDIFHGGCQVLSGEKVLAYLYARIQMDVICSHSCS